MATVTGYTSTKMADMRDKNITDAYVSDGTDGFTLGELILVPFGWATDPVTYPKVNLGDVTGLTGPQGPTGEVTTAALNAAIAGVEADIAAAHAAGAIAGTQLADLAVITSKLNDLAVTTAKIANLNVTEAKIADLAVTTNKIGSGAVTSSRIGVGQVTNSNLGADCVDGTKIGNDVIDSEHYVAGSIDNEHLANQSVSTSKIQNGAVGSSQIATNGIATANIADGQVTSAKIADGTIVNGDMAGSAVSWGKINKYVWSGSKGGDSSLNGVTPQNYIQSPTLTAVAGSLIVVTATFDFACVTVGVPIVACYGYVVINGVTMAQQAIFVPTANGQRATVTKTHYYVLPSNMSNGFVQLYAGKNGSFGDYTCGGQHTTLDLIIVHA